MNGRIVFVPLATIAVYAPAHAVTYMSIEDAQRLMFGTQTLTAVPLVMNAQQIAAVEQSSGVRVTPGTLRVWQAATGYFFVDVVVGKHDLISYAVALDTDGAVRQLEILEYREAYGGEIRTARWRAQFVHKHYGDAVRIGQGIDNISGATLSCTHVTDGVRRLLAIYALVIAH